MLRRFGIISSLLITGEHNMALAHQQAGQKTALEPMPLR
jgi:hypothetical protein